MMNTIKCALHSCEDSGSKIPSITSTRDACVGPRSGRHGPGTSASSRRVSSLRSSACSSSDGSGGLAAGQPPGKRAWRADWRSMRRESGEKACV